LDWSPLLNCERELEASVNEKWNRGGVRRGPKFAAGIEVVFVLLRMEIGRHLRLEGGGRDEKKKKNKGGRLYRDMLGHHSASGRTLSPQQQCKKKRSNREIADAGRKLAKLVDVLVRRVVTLFSISLSIERPLQDIFGIKTRGQQFGEDTMLQAGALFKSGMRRGISTPIPTISIRKKKELRKL